MARGPKWVMHRFLSTYHAPPVYSFDDSSFATMQCFLLIYGYNKLALCQLISQNKSPKLPLQFLYNKHF
uniref:Uncharacterized protein n=1 Tax=Vitis vinifera TaxID=29760 RepID=F6HJC5_VITVI